MPPNDPTSKRARSPAYDPDCHTKRSDSDLENNVDASECDYKPEPHALPPKSKRYISLADQNATFSTIELGAIVSEYKHDLALNIPIENEDIKKNYREAYNSILKTKRLDQYACIYRHPKHEHVQCFPFGPAPYTIRLRADSLVLEPDINTLLISYFSPTHGQV